MLHKMLKVDYVRCPSQDEPGRSSDIIEVQL